MFKRGETKEFEFTLPFDSEGEDVEKLEMVFVQSGVEKLYKPKASLTKDEYVVSYQLTEAESLAFADGIVRIQLNFKRDGEIEKSNEIYDRAIEPLRSSTV